MVKGDIRRLLNTFHVFEILVIPFNLMKYSMKRPSCMLGKYPRPIAIGRSTYTVYNCIASYGGVII